MAATKRCSRGGRCAHPDGPLLPATPDYFYRNRSMGDGLHSQCKACHKAAMQRWREENRDAYSAANRVTVRRWQKANPEKHQAQRQRYRERHPDRVRAQHRRWQLENPEANRAKARRYYERNREAINARRRARRAAQRATS